MLARWDDRSDTGQPLDVADELTGLTMAIISETMFGNRLDKDTHAVSQAITVLLSDINFRFMIPFYPSLRWPTLRNRRTLAAMRTVDEVVLAIIERRRSRSGRRTRPRRPAGHADGGATRKRARGCRTSSCDEVVTIFVAGHETTAVALTWTFYLLARHPEAEARLHAELAEVVAGRLPTSTTSPGCATRAWWWTRRCGSTRRRGSPTARRWPKT
ncbi:MAG: cytochrome P450 [Caldilineales bacterium]